MRPVTKKFLSLGLLANLLLFSAPLLAKDSQVTKGAKNASGAAPPTGASFPGYRVEASSNYAGTLACQICLEGIRVKSDRMGLTWILTAPKWNAQIFNTSTECYMDMPYSEWTKRPSFLPMAKKKTVLKLEKTNNTKTMHGLNCRQFLIMATFAGPPPGMPGSPPQKGPAAGKNSTKKSGKAGEKPQGNTVREAEMWIAKDPCVPKQFNELMAKIFDIPAEDGLPLSISLRQKTGKIASIWETVRLTKSRITRDEFKPIVGYKKVKTEVEMMLGDQDLGLSDDSGLDSKPVKRPKLDEMP